MAFLKTYEINNSGVLIEYWRITHFQVDRGAGILDVQVGGYVNAEMRGDGKQPVWNLPFRFTEAQHGSFNRIELEGLYELIRTSKAEGGEISFFVDAVNV